MPKYLQETVATSKVKFLVAMSTVSVEAIGASRRLEACHKRGACPEGGTAGEMWSGRLAAAVE
jgi:hypothetical protein